MHRDVDDAVKNGEDLIVRFLPSLVLQILVPERVGEEVQADVGSSTLKEPGSMVSSEQTKTGREWGGLGRVCKYKRGLV
jgi:hypothetical protein